MASSFSTSLKLEKMTTGEKAGLWGTTTNTNLDLVEQAVGGFVAVNIAAANNTLAIDDGALSDGRNMIIKLTGSLAASRTVTVPATEKMYVFIDGTTRTSNHYTISIIASGGTGVTMPVGAAMLVHCDGTNIVKTITEKGYITTTTAYTAVAGDQVLVDTSSTAVTITLPNSPSIGDEVHFTDSKLNFGSNKLVIGKGNSNILGADENKKATTNGDSFTLVYADATKGWMPKHSGVILSPDS
jgi:hypothetical protein